MHSLHRFECSPRHDRPDLSEPTSSAPPGARAIGECIADRAEKALAGYGEADWAVRYIIESPAGYRVSFFLRSEDCWRGNEGYSPIGTSVVVPKTALDQIHDSLDDNDS